MSFVHVAYPVEEGAAGQVVESVGGEDGNQQGKIISRQGKDVEASVSGFDNGGGEGEGRS